MRDLFFLGMYMMFLVAGAVAPFVFVLGYVWVDYFTPQAIAYSFMRSIPLSEIMAIATFAGFLLGPRQRDIRINGGFWLLLAFALWVTLTTFWAEVGNAAWQNWDWGFKTICFAAFMPFLIRTRTHIEAVVLVIVISILGNTLPFATKVVLSGGGYGRTLGLLEGNSLLAEGGTLSSTAVATVPLLLYLYKQNRFFPAGLVAKGVFGVAIGAAIITAIGTVERTGLVVLGVLALLVWWNSKRKIGALVIVAMVALIIAYFIIDASWKDRMHTIVDYQQDESDMRRIAVWMWTLNYVASHPFGGGFLVYQKDYFILNIAGQPQVFSAIAFHNIFFEVLGEHGIVGAALYCLIILMSFVYARRAKKAAAKQPEELQWMGDLAGSLQAALLIYLCGGMFQSMAFQPFVYYLFGIQMALQKVRNRQLAERPPMLAGVAPARVPAWSALRRS